MNKKEVFTGRLVWALFIGLAIILGLVFQPGVAPTYALFQSPLPPPNDNFADAEVISGLPFSGAQDVSSATTEFNEPQSCSFSPNTIWYAFTPTTNAMVRADTAGSSFFDTNLNVYQAFGPGITDLSFLNCASFGSSMTFNAQAGTT